jgi:DNA-binding Xre family transcriptional regulator
MKINYKLVKKMMIDKGISLKELCEMSGISYSHLALVTTGKKNMGPRALMKLAKALEVSIKDLIED